MMTDDEKRKLSKRTLAYLRRAGQLLNAAEKRHEAAVAQSGRAVAL